MAVIIFRLLGKHFWIKSGLPFARKLLPANFGAAIRHATRTGSALTIALFYSKFYSNREPSAAAFLSELEDWVALSLQLGAINPYAGFGSRAA